ncbi:hypothetical protein NDN08_007865 [Rhodosorus marinus]|uniref:HSF-type DNA-binding domain-containing protein n=1 Tax=Rhodosorus marinus TaxID=101924 RepID=A0AAV8UYR7_9RHOD|nr:hypothetical protein NDN08_007865 [Rhodosorus marinus]
MQINFPQRCIVKCRALLTTHSGKVQEKTMSCDQFSADETTRGGGQFSREGKEVTRKRPRTDKARSFISTVLLDRESKSEEYYPVEEDISKTAPTEETATTAASLPTLKTPAPFVQKLFSLLQAEENQQHCRWTDNGKSFTIWNPDTFARDVIPRYFRHNNFSSFIRQLNQYGFQKLRPDLWEFGHTDFRRGDFDRLKLVERRSLRSSSNARFDSPDRLVQSSKLPSGEDSKKTVGSRENKSTGKTPSVENFPKGARQSVDQGWGSSANRLAEISRREQLTVNEFELLWRAVDAQRDAQIATMEALQETVSRLASRMDDCESRLKSLEAETFRGYSRNPQ